MAKVSVRTTVSRTREVYLTVRDLAKMLKLPESLEVTLNGEKAAGEDEVYLEWVDRSETTESEEDLC